MAVSAMQVAAVANTYAYSSMQIVNNEKTLRADLSEGFLPGGTFAGGNIAILLSHLARDEEITPALAGIYPNFPLILAPEAVPKTWKTLNRSREQSASSPVLNKPFMDMYTWSYAPQPLES
jgi:alpha/beta hydrolase fold